MKITMIVAMSKDGFINHIGEKHASDWTSPEDQQHFKNVLGRFGLQIMGMNTYQAYKDLMKLTPGRLRMVFTHSPETYAGVPGQLEFTNDSVNVLLTKMEQAGFQEALLVGGGKMFSEFLHDRLIDEAYVTIEPHVFGDGIPFLPDGQTMESFPYLTIVEQSDINSTGTRLLHYIRS